MSLNIRMKTCSACGKSFPEKDFPTQIKRGKVYIIPNCLDCKRKKGQASYYKHHESRKARLRLGHLKNKESRNKGSRKYYQENKEYLSQVSKQNRKKSSEQSWKNRLTSKYGLSYEAYLKMLEGQNGKCEICGTDKPWTRGDRFCVDHDHNTGKVRGLLCHKCNIFIGSFEDDTEIMEKAALYLESFLGEVSLGL